MPQITVENFEVAPYNFANTKTDAMFKTMHPIDER